MNLLFPSGPRDRSLVARRAAAAAVPTAGALAVAVLAVVLTAVFPPSALAAAAAAEPETSPITVEVLAAMDLEADPCQDFYQYACGGWLESNSLPADQVRWARSFSVIREENRETIREILEAAAADPEAEGDRRRIGRYYASCMNEAAIEGAGVEPLAETLAAIERVEGAESLFRLVGELQADGADILFSLGVLPDFKRPDVNLTMLFQGGLGMPDRDYYVSDDPDKKRLLSAYRDHVERMLLLLADGAEGYTVEQAKADADRVLAFETALAEDSRPREEMRVPEKLYNKVDREGLAELAPGLPWDAFFPALGTPDVAEVNVAVPEFFTALAELLADSEPADLRAYLRWHAAGWFAGWLPERFVQANFDFYGKTLGGQQEIQPRWKRCVDATEGALGQAVGKVYVERKFAGDSKAKALEMIGDLEKSFAEALPRLAWMDEETRGRAIEKLEAIRDKIGYPDEWRDYSSLQFASDAYFANALAASAFEARRQLAKIGEPVDDSEWRMDPQTVNASYNPLQNEILFPAGILQPPMFYRDFPAAMNYGGIGAVVGHEITHGFDDQGRKFAPDGSLREWWEPEVAERFEARAQCVDDYYSGLEIAPGLNVNGRLTLGENIADLGGLKQAYKAFERWKARHDEESGTENGAGEPSVPGLTDDQLFFVAYAQVWCNQATAEVERMRITTDPHSPPELRVRGALAHNPDFARVFECEEGTPYHPKERCEVW